MTRKRILLVWLLVLVWVAAGAQGVLAQEAPTEKAPKAERHEFVIANFKTESGVTLPQARVVYGTYGKLNDARDNVSAPGYLTADQVGSILQLSPKTVYRLAKEDPSIPALKLGGSVRFPRERLERWLRDREQGRGRKTAG